jgi:predicted nucleic acid-binding protein
MPATDRLWVFLDTSALFAGIWSAEGGARLILQLGEAGAIRLAVAPQVLSEIESVLRRKASAELPALAVLLDRCNVEVVPAPSEGSERACFSLTGHAGDALVLAAAWDAAVNYFVTLDRKHLLGNAELAKATPFPVGTPGDFLAWLRARYIGEIS